MDTEQPTLAQVEEIIGKTGIPNLFNYLYIQRIPWRYYISKSFPDFWK